jgi:fucose permease
LLKRFGYKVILMAGATAQALRFAIFASDLPRPIVILALTLHGVAFACFFATAILYIEHIFPPKVRHSAQTVFGIALFGLGPALAGPYSELFDRYTAGPGAARLATDFHAIWWTQAAIALASAFAIAVFFRARSTAAPMQHAETPPDSGGF